MKSLGYNPILPLNEYIPDGEPHVFGNRIFLYGSHDSEGGTRYCAEGNYIGWSAPVDDPCRWTCHGVIFDAKQDPDYRDLTGCDLYAPDVCQGNDGKYYLFYNITGSSGSSGNNAVKVAVCDTPAGKYEYKGFVRNPDGTIHQTYLMGDPAVINDEGIIRLYFGWSLSMVAAKAHQRGSGFQGEKNEEYMKKKEGTPSANPSPYNQLKPFPPHDTTVNKVLSPVYQMLFKRKIEEVSSLEFPLMGANAIELEDDMLTVRGKPKRIVSGQFSTPADNDFFGHAFYEASSIRKINGLYYFIYSSENSHELCYATSRYPDRDFTYGGIIISIGNVGFQGRKEDDRTNMTANIHGSLECIGGQWYVFYHRQTHKSTFSRQACAEKVTILPNGFIPQVECTSMGLNEGDLEPKGSYPAAICCELTNGKMPHATNTLVDGFIPFITHDGEERFVKDIADGTKIGYKYFHFSGITKLELQYRATSNGAFEIWVGGMPVGKAETKMTSQWLRTKTEFSFEGHSSLFFIFRGEGHCDLIDFDFF